MRFVSSVSPETMILEDVSGRYIWLPVAEKEAAAPDGSAAPAAPALAGIRVLEVGTLIAGPFAGRLLPTSGPT